MPALASLLIVAGLLTQKTCHDSLISEALRINALTEGREAAVMEFNDRWLAVRKGTSLVDRPHILYPDSTWYGRGRIDDNVLPLAFGFVPDSVRGDVVSNVVAALRRTGFRPDVCPEVEPYLLPVLSESGFGSVAYFICDEHPEKVTNDRISEENVRAWKERYLAGISASDGLIRLRPDFSIQELDTLDMTVSTPLGDVHSAWEKDLMHAEWRFTLPKGTRAEVYVPSTHRSQVKRRCLARLVRIEDGCSVWRVRGGRHHFSFDFDLPEHVVERSFVFKNEDFPQCHSSTLCFAENGDLLAAFYGGTEEHNPDTKVRLSRRSGGKGPWSRPEVVAVPDKERYCLDNPVLFRIPEPGEPMLLWYKIRPGWHVKEGDIDLRTTAMWEARLMKSYDNGLTWTQFEPLPEGFLGPIKDKPVYHDGRLICPSSVEYRYHHEGTRIHFEWSDDKCRTLHWAEPEDVQQIIPVSKRVKGRVGENADNPQNPDDYYGVYHPIWSIQPTIFIHRDGTLQALSRTNGGKMSVTYSRDNGETWSKEVLTDMPQNGSGLDGTTLPDGRFALVYNDFESLPGSSSAPRTPLVLAISDDGIHWEKVLTLESDPMKEYSYPAVIADDEGYLHISYTWRRYRIKYVKVKV